MKKKNKVRIKKKRKDTLRERIDHLENEVLRELGDIGDIARRFVSLKEGYVKSMKTLNKKIKTLQIEVQELKKLKDN